MRELGHGHQAIGLLTAGHRHCRVVEDLEGHMRARGAGLSYRQRTAVREGAVTDVLEDMIDIGEKRRADPVGAFATHLRYAGGVTVHQDRQGMTANACRRH